MPHLLTIEKTHSTGFEYTEDTQVDDSFGHLQATEAGDIRGLYRTNFIDFS